MRCVAIEQVSDRWLIYIARGNDYCAVQGSRCAFRQGFGVVLYNSNSSLSEKDLSVASKTQQADRSQTGTSSTRVDCRQAGISRTQQGKINPSRNVEKLAFQPLIQIGDV